MQLILHTRGMSIGKRNDCFYCRSEKHERIFSPERVSSIAITTFCTISSSAILLAAQYQIPIYLMNAFGQIEGRLGGASYGNQAEIRRQQVYFCDSINATQWIIETFMLKTAHQIQNLKYLANRKRSQAADLRKVITQINTIASEFEQYALFAIEDVASSLMGIEGSIARLYWQAISDCMPNDMKFESRSRQPALDNFNAALNYLYGMFYEVVETALFSADLDPYLGILHADQHAKPTLSYDLIEPFRPWLDRLLIEEILLKNIKSEFFSREEKINAVLLNKEGKLYLISRYHHYLTENRLFLDKAPRTVRNQVNYFAGLLKEKIIENIAKQNQK